MPLVRFQVRNEYGLGDPELHRGAAKREDPKALLDGVAVAGLVGILRQLGDLAEFAAEIFHDLHEQVTATAARGHRMMGRIRRIEEALPTIEKAVQNQKSHIHFAYIAGSDWHSKTQIERDHLRHTDLPRFIMDSYEECRDPPRLFLLDKFDSAGPGSGACLRRYSDPTYFKRVCASLEPVKAEKVQKVRKIRKSKKKLSELKDGDVQHVMTLPPHSSSGDVQHVMTLPPHSSSMLCTSPGTDGQSIAAETLSVSDMRLKSEPGSRSTSFDSRTRFSFVGPSLDINSSMETENQDYNASTASMPRDSHVDICVNATAENGNVENADADDDFYNNYLEMQIGLGLPSAAWDEKAEIVKPIPKSRILIDPALEVNYPLASEEPGHSELSSQLNDSRTDAGGASKPEEPNVEGPDEVDDDDGSHQDSLLEQHTPSSSSVTWDEKAEIIRLAGPQLPDSDLVATIQDSDSHSVMPVACEQDAEPSMPGEIDKGEILCSVTNIQAQFPVSNHFDEVISETENYVDALNTLDSETDTDSEFQTKKELMPPSNFGYEGMEQTTDNMQDVGAPTSGSSDIESSIRAHSSINKDASSELPTLVCQGIAASAQAHDNGPSGCSMDNGHEKHEDDSSRMNSDEASADDLSSRSTIPSSQVALDTGITTTGQNLQVPKICDGPIKFWTNGGLLGLEPSKPPDFNVTNIVHESSVSSSHVNDSTILKTGYDASSLKSETTVLSNESKSRSGGKEGTLGFAASHRGGLCPEVTDGGTNNVVYPAEPSSSFYHNERNSGRPISKSQESVPVLPKPQLGNIQEAQSGNILANLTKADGPCGDESSVSSNGEISSGQRGPLKIGVSSSLTSLTRRLLTNSLQRKESLVHSDTSGPPGIVYDDSTNLQNISIPSDETKQLNGAASQECLEPNTSEKTEYILAGDTFSSMLHCSGQSSPPLEHMKISFHPMNGLETSKLRLEFPDSHLHESIEELMFPSFQLLPGPNIPLQGICYESDDDTFCRSYPYSPEDVSSPRSDSNSELWAHDEMSGSENHEIHDDSRRFSSSTASVSSFFEHEGRKHIGTNQASTFEDLDRENGIIAFHSGPFLDLPNLDSLKFSLSQQGGKCDSVSNKPPDGALSSLSSQPPPPPLPPLQWRTARPPVSVDDSRHSNNESKDPGDPQLIRSIALHQPEREVPWPPRTGETGNPDKYTKLSGHKDLNGAAKGGEPDEREDLLHQIRNKSFSLRPTVTSRPSLVPRSTTNVKVAAILEKANAIRQAFASSDEGGDDETWSDS